MTECEERIRMLERQLAEAKTTLKNLGSNLLEFEATELLYLATEMEVLKEHPSVELAGMVYGGLAAVMGRLATMAFRISGIAKSAFEAAGPDAEIKTSITMIN